MEPFMAEGRDRLSAIAARHASVADKIRALAGAGAARADIARSLQLDRYPASRLRPPTDAGRRSTYVEVTLIR
jgi:hypothetical protein